MALQQFFQPIVEAWLLWLVPGLKGFAPAKVAGKKQSTQSFCAKGGPVN